MVIPIMISERNMKINKEVSRSAWRSGKKCSATFTTAYTITIAMAALMAPLIIALIFKGFVINHRVAPTICMVFIRNRLLNIARRIVLSISTITKTEIRIATPASTRLIRLKLRCILPTTAVGYRTSSTTGKLPITCLIEVNRAEST